MRLDPQTSMSLVRLVLNYAMWSTLIPEIVPSVQKKTVRNYTFTGTIFQQSSLFSYMAHITFRSAGKNSFVLLTHRHVEPSLFWMAYLSLMCLGVINTLSNL